MPQTELTLHLRSLVEEATSELSRVSWRRMFGCDAAFLDRQIFALIWKEGRIGLRLPEEQRYSELLSLPGSEPWAPGGMKMSHWVLVPEDFHEDAGALARWVVEAHTLALGARPAPKKQASKSSSTKAKRTPSKKARGR